MGQGHSAGCRQRETSSPLFRANIVFWKPPIPSLGGSQLLPLITIPRSLFPSSQKSTVTGWLFLHATLRLWQWSKPEPFCYWGSPQILWNKTAYFHLPYCASILHICMLIHLTHQPLALQGPWRKGVSLLWATPLIGGLLHHTGLAYCAGVGNIPPLCRAAQLYWATAVMHSRFDFKSEIARCQSCWMRWMKTHHMFLGNYFSFGCHLDAAFTVSQTFMKEDTQNCFRNAQERWDTCVQSNG